MLHRCVFQCAYHDKDLIANRTDPSINLYHKHKHTHQRPVTVTHTSYNDIQIRPLQHRRRQQGRHRRHVQNHKHHEQTK